MAWGNNGTGQLGLGNFTSINIPAPITSLNDVIAISAGIGGHAMALLNNGTIKSWGYNYYGQLGNATYTDSNVPVSVSNLTGIVGISCGTYYSLALKNDSTVWAFGDNGYGQLGNNTNVFSNIAVSSQNLTGVVAIDGGGDHSSALKNNASMRCWGYGAAGQLGQGFLGNFYTAQPVTALCPVWLPVGVSEIDQQNSIVVYPNPSNGVFSIRQDVLSSTPQKIEVYNSIGEKIFEVQSEKQIVEINLSDVAKGIYFVRFQQGNRKSHSKVVIE